STPGATPSARCNSGSASGWARPPAPSTGRAGCRAARSTVVVSEPPSLGLLDLHGLERCPAVVLDDLRARARAFVPILATHAAQTLARVATQRRHRQGEQGFFAKHLADVDDLVVVRHDVGGLELDGILVVSVAVAAIVLAPARDEHDAELLVDGHDRR